MKNNYSIYPVILAGILMSTFYGCKEKLREAPVVTQTNLTSFTSTWALFRGEVQSSEGTSLTAHGICWSTEPDPTIDDPHTNVNGNKIGSFTSKAEGLAENTTYYVRSYATNSQGTSYGSSVSFTTQKEIESTVTDIDGNTYHTITIGQQVWMIENLKTTKYRNGDPIPNVTSDNEWINLQTGAYCDYENNSGNSSVYGKLYNRYAVLDKRNIAPNGWHVPYHFDWDVLTIHLSPGINIVDELKESGTTHWQSPNSSATNGSGFTALPGGYRDRTDGKFLLLGSVAYWWNSARDTDLVQFAMGRFLSEDSNNLGSLFVTPSFGLSVRCVKD